MIPSAAGLLDRLCHGEHHEQHLVALPFRIPSSLGHPYLNHALFYARMSGTPSFNL